MRARNGFRLGASVALEFGPDASERERRAILIQGEPHDVLLFGVGVRLVAYTAKLFAGIKQRLAGFINQQRGDEVFLMLRPGMLLHH
jgi:hypothetical protein